MFEFNKRKSESNKKKHGMDFRSAIKLWEDPNRLEIPAHFVDEDRFILIAKLDKEYWSAVFTKRNSVFRIISVRKSRKNEREICQSF